MYRGQIVIKTGEEVDQMAAAGRIQARCLQMLSGMCEPGISTLDLDRAAEDFIRSEGGVPTFKGYRGFPGSICASPNSMVVHGIPDATVLEEGDVLSIDAGVTYGGWVADAAITVPIGEVSEEAERLMSVTRQSLFDAIQQARPGNRLSDISHGVQKTVEEGGLSVIRTLVGHGVGREMHEDPQIPNFGEPGRGPELEEGMVFAIEPMVNVGGPGVRLDSDGWSVFSTDGSLAAHFEFTVAVTDDGPRILTPWHEDLA
jgi:methionyl aminopeptidase